MKASVIGEQRSASSPLGSTYVSASLQRAGRAFTRRGHALTVALLLLAGCAGTTSTPATSPASQGCALPAETRELAAEFVRLRTVHGHFQGGSWIAEVDDWMGHKHRVMIELGTRLGEAGCKREQIMELLGPPDLIAGPGDALYDQVRNQPAFEKPPDQAYELLIYHWRGAHDFLYFRSAGETITGSGWWHAYE
ncbi:MAG TPA: hypothetical protein VLC52_08735 [Anaerolineae bacterium]|nr:hypothetical protein [Anaerolineae bacterium]